MNGRRSARAPSPPAEDPRLHTPLVELGDDLALYAHEGQVVWSWPSRHVAFALRPSEMVELGLFVLGVLAGHVGEFEDVSFHAAEGSIRFENLDGSEIKIAWLGTDAEAETDLVAKALAGAVFHALGSIRPAYALLDLGPDDLKAATRRARPRLFED